MSLLTSISNRMRLGFLPARTQTSAGGQALIKAAWKGRTIAEAPAAQNVDGCTYFPAEAVHWEFLKTSSTTSVCHWKGTASYYSVIVDGKENPDAAWCYKESTAAAKHIKGQIDFWRGVKIVKGEEKST